MALPSINLSQCFARADKDRRYMVVEPQQMTPLLDLMKTEWALGDAFRAGIEAAMQAYEAKPDLLATHRARSDLYSFLRKNSPTQGASGYLFSYVMFAVARAGHKAESWQEIETAIAQNNLHFSFNGNNRCTVHNGKPDLPAEQVSAAIYTGLPLKTRKR